MTTQIELARPKRKFYNILASDCKFHTQVEEGTENSIKREYEFSGEDGIVKKGVKHEQVVQKITGVISNIAIYESDSYGKSLHITMGDNDLVISLSLNTSFAKDFMRKLPNIDIEQPVELLPYSMKIDGDKPKKGLSIKQDGKKVESYYFEKDAKGVYQNKNGYPDLPKEAKGNWNNMSKEDETIYYAHVLKFLLSEVEKNKKFNAVAPDVMKATVGSGVAYPTEDIKPEDIPFD
jgi:hypothetical protein